MKVREVSFFILAGGFLLFPWQANAPAGSGQTEKVEAASALRNIEQIKLEISAPEALTKENRRLCTDIEVLARRLLTEAGIKLCALKPFDTDGGSRPDPTAKLIVELNTLKAAEANLCAFHLRTQLARQVKLAGLDDCFNATVWQSAAFTDIDKQSNAWENIKTVAARQLRAFIKNYHAANPSGKKQADSNDSTKQPTPLVSAHEKKRNSADAAQAEYKYVASKSSKVFHTADCPFAARISPSNLVGHKTKADAINAGKRPCKRCNP